MPLGAAAHGPEGVAEAEQFVEDAYQVGVVPRAVVQEAAHEFGYEVKERFVLVGRVASDQFQQRHEVVARMLSDETGKGRR